MNPQVGQPQNPFVSFLQKLQSQGAPQAPGQNNPMLQAMMQKQQSPAGTTPGGAPVGGMPGGQGAGIPGSGAQSQPQMQDASLPGQNPGTTKQLLGAMSQLHQVITQLTDPQEIRMIRSIIILLNQLIQRDQEVQNTQTGQFTQGQGQPPVGPAAGGMPRGGAPSPMGSPMGGGPSQGSTGPAGRGLPTGMPPGQASPAL
jgi:hypothetical protein